MEPFDFENMYFHGLSGNIITFNSDDIVIKTSLERLDAIIKSGGLLSRNKLAKNGIIYSWKPVYNEDDYISLCVKNPNESEYEGLNEGLESSYVTYVTYNRIALIIDESINMKNEFRTGVFRALPGERQVKDRIDFSNVVGISVMFENVEKEKEAAYKIKKLLSEYNITLPIVDKNFSSIDLDQMIK